MLGPHHCPRFKEILQRAWLHQNKVTVHGTSSAVPIILAIASEESSSFNELPQLVVTAHHSEAEELREWLTQVAPARTVYCLPHFESSPYSGANPRRATIAERVRFMHGAQNSLPGDIFICSIGALLQRTLPYEVLKKSTLRIAVGEELPETTVHFLNRVGYEAAPRVEDVGQFAWRGGIVDIFSPAHPTPLRIELFGDQIESIRSFDPTTQASHPDKWTGPLTILPVREAILQEADLDAVLQRFRDSREGRAVAQHEFEEAIRALSLGNVFDGMDFLLSVFYSRPALPVEHFSQELRIWLMDPPALQRQADQILAEFSSEQEANPNALIAPKPTEFTGTWSELVFPPDSAVAAIQSLEEAEFTETGSALSYVSYSIREFFAQLAQHTFGTDAWVTNFERKVRQWMGEDYSIVFATETKTQFDRLKLVLERTQLQDLEVQSWTSFFQRTWGIAHPSRCLLIGRLPESVRISEEKLILIRGEDLFGRKQRYLERKSNAQAFSDATRQLNFGDLNPGDRVVHLLHGVGQFDGLKKMNLGGIESEFLQLSYRDNDKLYLPVYRLNQLQKFSAFSEGSPLDKLGGTSWEKAKAKVKNAVRDIASELLKLYAERRNLVRPAHQFNERDVLQFAFDFPFEETEDQLRAIRAIEADLRGPHPMDRLICGDVGFGKTEVAMRATFAAVSAGSQVALIAPTTVLSFQHGETFKKRFAKYGYKVAVLNRFVSTTEAKAILKDLKQGDVHILIGTHRLLSRDIEFKKLGLLIIDEEQKFGVVHKEKLKKMRAMVDTLAMSATPIPRTLNMSLAGVRDLSLINTAPLDRLPTRTFIAKWDDQAIRKSILSEVQRGGQVYFIHNRVQSIFALAEELRLLVPEVRMAVAHGQMPEDQLENTMIQFFNHEIDVLICTAIVESGVDVPRANTMFIDKAHLMGLSQLYQLRGRVGRSKARAYCYLLLPRHQQLEKTAQERLKVIQQNSQLGSGIRIAQYDLELRGAGSLLGEEQSGHLNSVGFEMYLDLLNETVEELKGEKTKHPEVDPEINLRLPALIPDKYISDIRLRLSYYKALSEVRSQEDLEKIELELKDQFGELPAEVVNLMGIMLIRSQCRELGVRDLSAGTKNISLIFVSETQVSIAAVIKLAMKDNKKYSLTPDQRLNIRMNEITWTRVFDELDQLKKQLLP